MFIYHITQKTDWEEAEKKGSYSAESLQSEGFIHCSLHEQVLDTARRYYAGITGLVLLEIDPELLTSRYMMEPSTGDAFYPHVYGEINVSAVKRIATFEPQHDGEFIFPGELD
jgi:uncharacterized protein (DUF952 family)